MTDVQISAVDESMLDTVLAPDVGFEGTLICRKPLMIKGTFAGVIRSSSDIYIDENATVQAEIRAVNVVVRGRVKGSVAAEGRVELASTCVLEGDVSAPEVTMETGCQITGECRTVKRREDGRLP